MRASLRNTSRHTNSTDSGWFSSLILPGARRWRGLRCCKGLGLGPLARPTSSSGSQLRTRAEVRPPLWGNGCAVLAAATARKRFKLHDYDVEAESEDIMTTNVQNYISVCFNLYNFAQKTARQNILERTVASIPRIQSALNFFMNAILICSDFFQIRDVSHALARSNSCPKCGRSVFASGVHEASSARRHSYVLYE